MHHSTVLILFTWLSFCAAEMQSQISSNASERFVGIPLTVTTISQVHFTSTVTIHAICAIPVNVTGICSRRWGKFVEEPEYLTFDDDSAEEVDRLINPTTVHPMEMTRLPSRDVQVTVEMDPVPSQENLESSMNWLEESRHKKFFPFGGLFTNIIQLMKTSTVTVTWVQSVTTIFPVTVTKTFFIQNCTPSPFPFSLCQRK